MIMTNLYPTRFSKKGIESLNRQIRQTEDFERLKQNGMIDENDRIKNKSIDAYFELATIDDRSVVYFCETTKKLVMPRAGLEVGSWSAGIKVIEFEVEDFEFSSYDMGEELE